MQTQATITIACKSGQVYQAVAPEEFHLPFLCLGTGMKVPDLDKLDEQEVRLGLSVAEFVLIGEKLLFDSSNSEPQAGSAPVWISPRQEEEVEEFALTAVFSLINWSDINDKRLRDREVLAREGVVTADDLEALAVRNRAHLAAVYRANSAQSIVINRETLPDREMLLYCEYDMNSQMFDASEKALVELMTTYLSFRFEGVTQERLLSAMAVASQELIAQGVVKKY